MPDKVKTSSVHYARIVLLMSEWCPPEVSLGQVPCRDRFHDQDLQSIVHAQTASPSPSLQSSEPQGMSTKRKGQGFPAE